MKDVKKLLGELGKLDFSKMYEDDFLLTWEKNR